MIETTQQRITALEKKVGTDAKSPLFAQLAHYYLEISRAQDALRLCDAGLANFPFYTTGHLIKGKALVALNMRAEARREFEFVLDFLPNNEAVSTLLAQLPPSEEETLAIVPREIQPEASKPEQGLPTAVEYRILPTPPLQKEPEYGFGGIEQPVVEQQPELSPLTTPSHEPTFFDAITQAPVATTTEDPFGFRSTTPSIEPSVAPEPSSFGGFDVSMPGSPTVPETQTPSIEQPGGFEFTLSTPDQSVLPPPLPQEEESFEPYASRRRTELSGEDTISLEDYLDNTMIVLPQASSPETPVSIDIRNTMEELPTDTTIVLPQALPPTETISIEMQSTIEELPTGPTIVLPQAPPPETPPPTVVQNTIEELATKLQTARKITPIINITQKETPPKTEPDTPTGVGFVTPTLAEIYAKQGWFDDAIKAYKTLARNKPGEKERYEKRIAELEELKKQSRG